jgi:hypothetical protein
MEKEFYLNPRPLGVFLSGPACTMQHGPSAQRARARHSVRGRGKWRGVASGARPTTGRRAHVHCGHPRLMAHQPSKLLCSNSHREGTVAWRVAHRWLQWCSCERTTVWRSEGGSGRSCAVGERLGARDSNGSESSSAAQGFLKMCLQEGRPVRRSTHGEWWPR